MNKNLINDFILAAGVNKIAAIYHVNANAVRHWRDRGIPAKYWIDSQFLALVKKHKFRIKDLMTETKRLQTLQKSQQRPVSPSDTSKQ